MWPELILVNGRVRHPQSQGCVERGNNPLKDSLTAWMRDNNTSRWTHGLLFVQWSLNTTFHDAIKIIPYKALFGMKPKIGLGTRVPKELLQNIKTGIEEEVLINLLKSKVSDQEQPAVEK